MGYEDLTQPESQINPETGLTQDALNILSSLSMAETTTFSDDLSFASPLPHYEDKYPPEAHPALYTGSTSSSIEQFDKDVDTLNALIDRAHHNEKVGSPEDLETFDRAYNEVLTLVRGSSARTSDFKHLSETHSKDEFMSA